MDEHAGGYSPYYMTSEPLLTLDLELLSMSKEDIEHLGVDNLDLAPLSWTPYVQRMLASNVAGLI